MADLTRKALQQAIRELRPAGVFTIRSGSLGDVDWAPGTKPVSEEELSTVLYKHMKVGQLEACHAARKEDYPSVEEQLDDLYHQGAFSPSMMARIRETKNKYPKP